MSEILNKNSINTKSNMDGFSNIYLKFLGKNNFIYVLFLFKVVSSPRKSVSLSILKIIISLYLLYNSFLKQFPSIKREFLPKRLDI